MKLKGFPMTEYVYNELIRTYANACRVPNVKEEHVDMYLKDSWELIDNMLKEGIDPNINVLNSLVLLHAQAIRPAELEGMVLPMYEKYKVKHDLYTYQNLMRAYLNTRDNETILKLYDRMIYKDKIKPN